MYKQLQWNKTAYFDLETAPADVDFWSLTNSPWLDIRNVGISAYTFILPSNLYTEDMQQFGIVSTLEIEDAQFIAIQYYNNDNRELVKQNAIGILDAIANNIQTPTYIVGFNNNRFDNIAFEQYLTNEKEAQVYKYKNSQLYFTDLLPFAHTIGLHHLSEVGDFVGLPKLHSTDNYMEYNLRDTAILIKFLKYINTKWSTKNDKEVMEL